MSVQPHLLVPGEKQLGVDPLLVRYAPRIVIFPEDLGRHDPPWPARTHDYHPRSVEVMLALSHTREVKPARMGDADSERQIATLSPDRAEIARAALAMGIDPPTPDWVMRFTAYVGHPLENVPGTRVTRAFAFLLIGLSLYGLFSEFEVSTVVGGIILGAILLLLSRPSSRPPIGADVIRERLQTAWPMTLSREAITMHGKVDAKTAWSTYQNTMRGNGDFRYPRTVYCRTVQAGSLVAVQYWLFFFFNHWRNVHEADWELISVFHNPDTDQPEYVGISSHEDGLRRKRESVTWLDDGPIVYCAVGSHALYFQPKADGYVPSLDLGRYMGAGRSRRMSAGNSRDWVPDVDPAAIASLPRQAYQLVPLPKSEDVHPSADSWDTWWWLAYGGGWGRITPVDGPANQRQKWAAPHEWAELLQDDELIK